MVSPAQVLTRLLKQGVLLVLTVGLGALGGYLYAANKSPSYTAQAYVVVVAASGGDVTTAAKFAQAYGRITTQGAVLANAAARVGQGTSVTRLRRQVQASTSPDVPLVEITGSAGAPKEAADLANGVADALIGFGNDRQGRTGVRLASFATATPPEAPSSPNEPIDVAVGAAAGLLIGGLAVMAGVGRRPPHERAARPGVADRPTPAEQQPMPISQPDGSRTAEGFAPIPADDRAARRDPVTTNDVAAKDHVAVSGRLR